jgi:1-pyrroline-5-carboxylate dehydrogenase
MSLLSTEFFAPFQIVTKYAPSQVDDILTILEQIPHHLTASVCSNDIQFIHKIVSNSVNGVTYTGILSRTTGAPQNHFFGPSGDPRGAGIGTPEAIINTWTCHREIITDVGPLTNDVTKIPPT